MKIIKIQFQKKPGFMRTLFKKMLGDTSESEVVAELEGKVEVDNLIKLNNGLKLVVDKIMGSKVYMTPIRKIDDLGYPTEYIIRSPHWERVERV